MDTRVELDNGDVVIVTSRQKVYLERKGKRYKLVIGDCVTQSPKKQIPKSTPGAEKVQCPRCKDDGLENILDTQDWHCIFCGYHEEAATT